MVGLRLVVVSFRRLGQSLRAGSWTELLSCWDLGSGGFGSGPWAVGVRLGGFRLPSYEFSVCVCAIRGLKASCVLHSNLRQAAKALNTFSQSARRKSVPSTALSLELQTSPEKLEDEMGLHLPNPLKRHRHNVNGYWATDPLI